MTKIDKRKTGIPKKCKHSNKLYSPPNYDKLVCTNCGKEFPIINPNREPLE